MDTQILKKIITAIGTPVFVYNESILLQNIQRIFDSAKKFGLKNRIKLYISYFCNSNPHLFKLIQHKNVATLVQTKEEYYQLKKFNLDTNLIISPSFLSNKEIDFWVSKGFKVYLASLAEIRYHSKNFDIPSSFRLDLTFGSIQRTGIKKHQLKELSILLSQSKKPPFSFSIYAGTGSSLRKMKSNVKKVLKVYKKYFSTVQNINLGGGFSFNYKKRDAENKHFDWENYFSYLHKQINRFQIPDCVNFLFEPGREIFADVGKFIISVQRIVNFKGYKNIGTNGSYVYMPSATITKRQHNLSFFNKDFEELQPSNRKAVLSGCTTLSRDYVFPGKVKIPQKLHDGSIIVIHDIGAYGATQHMEFLNKKPCPEILINKNKNVYLITEKGQEDDKIRYLLSHPKKI